MMRVTNLDLCSAHPKSEVTLSCLDVLADLLPFVLEIFQTMWKARAFEICEKACDNGVDRSKHRHLD